VVLTNDIEQTLELNYPCDWRYKLIGHSLEDLQTAVHDVLQGREHQLEHSNVSKSGKYISLNLDILVHNEEERQFFYEALKSHQSIKMVL